MSPASPAPSNLVAVLIASPTQPVLDADLVGRAARALGGATPRILKAGVAVEFTVSGAAPALHAALAEALGRAPVDVAIVPAEGRRKRLLIADMDSTFIEQECIDELAEAFGLAAEIEPITQRAMRGEIAFEPALRERVALFKGRATDEAVATILRERVTFTPGGRTTVATMRAAGAWTALVSGGFTSFTGPVAGHLGFDENRGNILEVEGSRLAGLLREPVLGSEAKVLALDDMLGPLGLSRQDAIAVGDGANDIPMLKAAGLGVAFRAKPAVAAVADVAIEHGDLTALLYLQGFAESEFAAA
jgi:phosphoserine phosphatase